MARPKEISDEDILVAARSYFIEHGPGVSVSELARVVGVSHTTIFNRFGTKDDLLRAALAPPTRPPWIATLEAGPTDAPLKEQLTEHALTMARYVGEVQVAIDVLHASGIDLAGMCSGEHSGPAVAFEALSGWLRRAQDAGRLGSCDVDTLATALLGVLHTKESTQRICAAPSLHGSNERYVREFVELLWTGISGT